MPPLESHGGHQEAQEVLDTLLLRQGRDITDPLWLLTQTDNLVDIRSTLVGWLRKAIIAHHQCSITTLEHAINLLDRFLFKTGFLAGRVREMELAAVATFSLAAKMEEVYVPSLGDELQAGAPWQRFRPAAIELMEWAVLKTLTWRLACVTASDLVQPMLEASPAFCSQAGSLPAAAAAAGPLGAAAARGLAESTGDGSLERRERLGARVRKKAFGLLLASVTDPALTQYKASEVAAASLALAVDSICPESLACSIQASLLARYPEAATCLHVLLPHVTLRRAPATAAIGRLGTGMAALPASPAAADTEVESSGDSPAAKRYCRAVSPTSVLEL
ncbi:hypothetical protein N2152v2_006192 [Parachlorella kessleri]